jgi:exopolysaccharide biosynthesis polyprenyl glycosylphosphotransferase
LRGDVKIMGSPLAPTEVQSVIIADLHFDHADEWERMLAKAALRGIPVYHYKQIWEAVTGRVRIEHLSENAFGTLLPDLNYRKFKRLSDTAIVLLLLPLLVIPFCVIALLIKIDSPGPVLFRQARIGYGRREFEVIKFRTMHVAGEDQRRLDQRESSITKDDDERITRIGKFLRRTRIDELPQLLNVLKGEMSWIGPRPEAAPLSEWYEREVPFYAYRHIVRPGITGWAQINQGHVTGLDDIHAKLQYDFFYIKNFSCWIDILIVVRTIVVMTTGFGAK